MQMYITAFPDLHLISISHFERRPRGLTVHRDWTHSGT